MPFSVFIQPQNPLCSSQWSLITRWVNMNLSMRLFIIDLMLSTLGTLRRFRKDFKFFFNFRKNQKKICSRMTITMACSCISLRKFKAKDRIKSLDTSSVHKPHILRKTHILNRLLDSVYTYVGAQTMFNSGLFRYSLIDSR